MENITLGQIAAAIGLLGILGSAIIYVVKVYIKHENRFKSIENRVSQLENDSLINKTENRIILKGLLSCLKGLKEQGCNGPVTKSIAEIEEYLLEK